MSGACGEIIMSENENIRKDFEQSEHVIEEMAEKELQKIKEQARKIKDEARRVGEEVEASVKQTEENVDGKKG